MACTIYTLNTKNQILSSTAFSGSNPGPIEHLGGEHYAIADTARIRQIQYDGTSVITTRALHLWATTGAVGGICTLKDRSSIDDFEGGPQSFDLGAHQWLTVRIDTGGALFGEVATYNYLKNVRTALNIYGAITKIPTCICWDGAHAFIGFTDFTGTGRETIRQFRFSADKSSLIEIISWNTGIPLEDMTWDGESIWGITSLFSGKLRPWDTIFAQAAYVHGISGAKGICWNGQNLVVVGT